MNAAAFGEYSYGVAQNSKNMVYVKVGTGIGGTVILNGELYLGSNGGAGEVGYMSIEDERLEALGSTTALATRVKKRLTDSEINSGKEIFKLAKQGNKICIEEIDTMCKWLVKELANIAYMLQPDMIVLGGGVMEQEEYLSPIIEKWSKKMLSPFFYNEVTITFATLGNQAGLIGAFALYRQTF